MQEYGNIEVMEGVPKGHAHIRGKRLQRLCRELRIKYAPAVIGFEGNSRYGYKPICNGVVVTTRSAEKLTAAIEERDRRVADQRKRRAAQIQRRAEQILAQPTGVLGATFAVNREAKRLRDRAAASYGNRRFSWATEYRTRKEFLYSLKDRGIMKAFREGLILPVEIHGGLCCYRGHGYCFHSRLCPEGLELVENTAPLFVEARPREATELAVEVAIAVLEQLPTDCAGFDVLDVPHPPHDEDGDLEENRDGGSDLDEDWDDDRDDWRDGWDR